MTFASYGDKDAALKLTNVCNTMLSEHFPINMLPTVRTVDAIFPNDKDAITAYTDTLLSTPFSIASGELRHAYAETEVIKADWSLITRTIIQDGFVQFPPDLEPMSLVIPSPWNDVDDRHVVLDSLMSFTPVRVTRSGMPSVIQNAFAVANEARRAPDSRDLPIQS